MNELPCWLLITSNAESTYENDKRKTLHFLLRYKQPLRYHKKPFLQLPLTFKWSLWKDNVILNFASHLSVSIHHVSVYTNNLVNRKTAGDCILGITGTQIVQSSLRPCMTLSLLFLFWSLLPFRFFLTGSCTWFTIIVAGGYNSIRLSNSSMHDCFSYYCLFI